MSRRGAPLPGEPVQVRVESLHADGRGVAVVAGRPARIFGALAGEEVLIRYRRRRRGFDEADVVEVVEAAKDRVTPLCPHFKICGGCTLQHLDHPAQLAIKQKRLLNHLSAAGELVPATVLEPLYAQPRNYRRKARLGVRHVAKKGGAMVGFREKGGSRVAELEACAVLAEPADALIRPLRDLITALDARARVPQVEVAVADAATALVLRHLDPLSEHDLETIVSFGRAHGTSVYLQPGGPGTVHLLWPEDAPALAYSLSEPGLAYRFEPTDFVQVNAAVNRLLVARAVALLEPNAGERVLDLFCGLGNFTLAFARNGAHVTGLEGEAALVDRARGNARDNGFAGVGFEAVNLASANELVPWLEKPWDKLFLDPPRSGAREIVESLSGHCPARIVYVSCNPETLARDASVLVKHHGYRLTHAGIVDMFPHTNHVEAIACFKLDQG